MTLSIRCEDGNNIVAKGGTIRCAVRGFPVVKDWTIDGPTLMTSNNKVRIGSVTRKIDAATGGYYYSFPVTGVTSGVVEVRATYLGDVKYKISDPAILCSTCGHTKENAAAAALPSENILVLKTVVPLVIGICSLQ